MLEFKTDLLPIKYKLAQNKQSIMIIIHRQLSQTWLVAVILVSKFAMAKSENVETISAINPTDSFPAPN